MKTNIEYDVIVIGGGPAGLAAAIAAREHGSERVLIIERNEEAGGILPQCIHNGFGAVNFGQDLPGPQYALRYARKAQTAGVNMLLDTFVMEITADRDVYAMSSSGGYMHFRPRALVLAMGCRERTRAQIRLPGTRAAGIYSAGTVQRLVNIEGYMPGRKFVILGSGDIGMIMARRLTIEGAQVLGVYELMPYLTGLRRNFVQCLQDYEIPLHLSMTVTNILGKDRVEGVEVSRVDENLKPVPGTEQVIACDSLLLSVGLIPENELSRQAGVQIESRTGGPRVDEGMRTSVPGIFAAGNVTGIYDLVDYVSKAGEVAGRSAAQFAAQKGVDSRPESAAVALSAGLNVGSVIPQTLDSAASRSEETFLTIRPRTLMECKVRVSLMDDGQEVFGFWEKYARPAEMIIRKVDDRIAKAIHGSAGRDLQVVIHEE
jgi:NADPH-dependent 2,4-dienoyl-CoA reductase/sulfur reductase-like enzyme